MHGKFLLQAPLCHKEPARSKQNTPLVGGFGCDELVLYGIRELAQQFLGSVENSDRTSPFYCQRCVLIQNDVKEEWEIVLESFDFDPEMNHSDSDWTFYKVNQRNIQTLLPRLGHLMQDQSSPPRSRGQIRDHHVATPALLCHIEPARASKAPYAGSLWYKRAGVAT